MDQNVELVFKPRADPFGDPMRIFVLFGGGASAEPFMFGDTYMPAGAIALDENASGIEKNKKRKIPTGLVDVRGFYKEYNKPITDMEVREYFFDKVFATIEEMDVDPDIVANSGNMLIIPPKFLDVYWNLNNHPADLSKLGKDGKRKYTGAKAVRDAINAGEKFTYTTIHIMDETVDGGPIICISDGLPVHGRDPEEQQDEMKWVCDGPAYRRALYMISNGDFGIDSQKNIYVKKGNEFVMTYRHRDNKYFAKNLADIPGPDIKRF